MAEVRKHSEVVPHLAFVSGRGAGRRAAVALMEMLNYRSESSWDNSLRDLDKRLLLIGSALGARINSSWAAQREGSFRAKSNQDLFAPPEIAARSSTSLSRRYIVAHELGHGVLDSLCNLPTVTSEQLRNYDSEPKREAFCREFASEITLPLHAFKKATYRDFWEALSASEKEKIRQIYGRDWSQITFYHLAAFARKTGAPLSVVLTALNRHAILIECNCAAAVFRFSRNVYTSDELGLRIWINAVPPWGFIPSNQRVARLGFKQAESALRELQHGETRHCAEKILVKERDFGDSGRKWTNKQLASSCYYTVIETQTLGKLLFVTWSWPQPKMAS